MRECPCGPPSSSLPRTLTLPSYVPVHLEYILTEILKNAFRATVEWHQRHFSPSEPIAPVVITISAPPPAHHVHHSARAHGRAHPPRFLSLRVSDRGGGVSPANMSRIFSYSFTTAGRGAAAHRDDGDDADDDCTGGGPYAAQHMSGGAAIGAGLDPGAGGGGESLFAEMAGRGVQMGMGTIAGLGYGLPMSRLYARYFGGSLDFKSLDGWGACSRSRLAIGPFPHSNMLTAGLQRATCSSSCAVWTTEGTWKSSICGPCNCTTHSVIQPYNSSEVAAGPRKHQHWLFEERLKFCE